MPIEETIQAMLNKPYGADLEGQNRKYICWSFCREIYSLYGLKLPSQHKKGLARIVVPISPCIVLFRPVIDWHAGVVWPDGLHFIHVYTKNIFDLDCKEYVVRKERLTAWPFNLLIEGYYVS